MDFDLPIARPTQNKEISKHHSFGLAGFSIYISAGEDELFSLEFSDGKSYRGTNERIVRIVSERGKAPEEVLHLTSYGQNAFVIEGLGWRYKGSKEIRPLVIGRNGIEAGNAINLNRILDMIRTREFEKQLKENGAMLVTDLKQIKMDSISRPNYLVPG